MKRTILVCDLCPEPKANAVATVDVCAKHKPKVQGNRREVEDPEELERIILEFIAKHGKGAPTPISLETSIPRWTIQTTMLRMCKGKLIVREGRGKGATYRKA